MKALNTLLVIFTLGFLLRFLSVYPANTIVGFDQARDFFDATSIVFDQNLKIIGPTAGNNPNLHHGVLYLYYILVPLITLGGNPIWAVLWNSLFNAGSCIVLFFLNKSLFGSIKAGIFAAIIASVSYQFIQYSGWLSNPTPTIFTVPLFFLGLWKYYLGKNWGLLLASFALGLSIEFELFFLYLIPTAILYWLVLKPKLPSLKLVFSSFLIFCLTTITMILTEIKFHFAGAFSLLGAGGSVGFGKASIDKTLPAFLDKMSSTFALNLSPQNLNLGIILGLFTLIFLIYKLLNKKTTLTEKKAVYFLLLYLCSPVIMLSLGYHNAPWFLIGVPPAIALSTGYILSKTKLLPSLVLIVLIVWGNLTANINAFGKPQILLEPDKSSQMSKQLQAIDYTYQSSDHKEFTINTLTNPLYINAVWAYHYKWYGKNKYGYLPSFSGGDQLHPYDTLPKTNDKEEFLYLIIDTSPRIPYSYQIFLIEWANKNSKLLEEKDFDGILVQKRLLPRPN